MARTGITFDDVQRAIDTLLQRQEAPSVQKVRNILGTGSFTTISEHLREWRTRREERTDVPPPQGMPAELQALAEELWNQAQTAATDNLSHYREESDRQVAAAQERVADADRRAEDAEQRESALSAHLVTTEKRLQESIANSARMESTVQAQEQQLEKERQRSAQLEDQLARLQQENERLGQAHQVALGELQTEHAERLRQEEQRHETAEARLMGMLDDARQERQAAEKSHAQKLQQAEQRYETLQQQLQRVRADLLEEEKRHKETLLARSRAEDNARAKQHENELLSERIEEHKRQLTAQAERIHALEAKLDEKIWSLAAQRREAVRNENESDTATSTTATSTTTTSDN